MRASERSAESRAFSTFGPYLKSRRPNPRCRFNPRPGHFHRKRLQRASLLGQTRPGVVRSEDASNALHQAPGAGDVGAGVQHDYQSQLLGGQVVGVRPPRPNLTESNSGSQIVVRPCDVRSETGFVRTMKSTTGIQEGQAYQSSHRERVTNSRR